MVKENEEEVDWNEWSKRLVMMRCTKSPKFGKTVKNVVLIKILHCSGREYMRRFLGISGGRGVWHRW